MSTDHTLTPRAKQMFLVIENYLNSQLSRKVFCQQQGITYSTLQWWLTKYRQANSSDSKPALATNQFIPIEFKTAVVANPQPHCRIEFPNGIVIQLFGHNDPQFIRTLVQD